MRMLYILCGLPYAGKTTLARFLQRQLGWVYIALDDINGEFGRGLNGAAITPDEWEHTYQQAYQRIRHVLRQGKTVLFDAANFTREQRETLRTFAKEEGKTSRVIYVTTSEEVARIRWMANSIYPTRSIVRDEDFQQVVDKFEAPTADEHVLLFDGQSTPQQWLQGQHELSLLLKRD